MTNDLSEETLLPVPEGYHEMNWRSGFALQMGPIYEKDIRTVDYRRAFRVTSRHTNGRGTCHGGMLMAFADMAFGHAVTVTLNRYWATVRLLNDFASAGQIGDWVEGNAQVMAEEDGFVTVKGRIWTGDKTLIIGSGVFKALGERP